MPSTDPEKLREQRRRHYLKNKEKVIAANEAWRKANPDKANASAKRSRDRRSADLVRRYGITNAERDALVQKQEGKCAVCREEKKLHVDHCHDTGKVRGMLCFECNTGIGKLRDSPEMLLAAHRYLLGV